MNSTATLEREAPALKRKPGRPRKTAASRLADQTLNLHGLVWEMQTELHQLRYTEPSLEAIRRDVLAAMELLRPELRRLQAVLEWERARAA